MMKIVFSTGYFDGGMRKICGIPAEEGLILRTGKEIPGVQHINGTALLSALRAWSCFMREDQPG